MKKIVGLLFAFLLLSCGAKKPSGPTIAALLSECPKNGTCTVKILSHKSMVVTQDDYGMHYKLEENPEKNVVLYTYSRTIKGDVQDASYREEVVFEVNNDLKNGILSDPDLQSSKMLFGRFCFCKGQTGYYNVTNGKMALDLDKNLSLDFTVSEIPQVIKQLRISIK
ncbi:MAG TPA: hypothetical protein VK528_03525 [Flavobacterium sp.]|nr:hypothetical protein [Flavobacterium sp.]